ncbi:hypothetical protein ALP58_200089 [Pseudomonas savastanoi]|uniref:Uncharacterized protein n=1 Tax=Pseudomonas savastanoi TaxID=29438 RepID=A0A3M5GUU9_PSESS|nr:hypothetical protein ALP58_200089 [Pseudomonas savastanoi]
MVVAVVAFSIRQVDGQVNGNAVAGGQLDAECRCQFLPRTVIQFGGERDDPLATGPAILALFSRFGSVPQGIALGTGAVRQHDFCGNNTTAPGVVMDKTGAHIDQLGTRPISSSSNGRTSGAACYRLGTGMEDGDGFCLCFGL